MNRSKIMVIDDDEITLELLGALLHGNGYDVKTFAHTSDALAAIENWSPELALIDMEMPEMNGFDVMQHLRKFSPGLRVIVMTAYADGASVRKFLEAGALDYLPKPFSSEELLRTLRETTFTDCNDNMMRKKDEIFEKRMGIVGQSKKLAECVSTALKITNTNLPVLLLGENGTGKELLADLIHYNSMRKYSSLIKVNCGAIPKELAENEFFGHEKGAFTGAVEMSAGKLEMADKGTLLLDEIGEIDGHIQSKLLRALEYKTFERLGGKKSITSDFRLICATNRNISADIASGLFREDLYYRLNAVVINLPPLRERREDIPILVEYFMRQYASRYMFVARKISDEAMDMLTQYDWPGNIRELKNVIQSVLSTNSGMARLEVSALPQYVRSVFGGSIEHDSGKPLTLAEVEQQQIMRVLDKVNGRKTKAAELLGISVRTLYNKMNEYGMAVAAENESE